MAHALIQAARAIATGIAAKHAPEVDREARFPHESIAAMKAEKLMSAAVPEELGGAGLGLRELGNMCAAIGREWGSSAMVLAMPHIQVACIARHGLESPYFRRYLQELVAHQWVLASMTSEVGTSGDMRSSVTA